MVAWVYATGEPRRFTWAGRTYTYRYAEVDEFTYWNTRGGGGPMINRRPTDQPAWRSSEDEEIHRTWDTAADRPASGPEQLTLPDAPPEKVTCPRCQRAFRPTVTGKPWPHKCATFPTATEAAELGLPPCAAADED
jgi:hypothetical protein